MSATQNDLNSLRSESFENKVAVLYYYLCESGYNMLDIGQSVLGDCNEQASKRVSGITRCYGFNGRNGGTFRNIGATIEDVAAFVRMYPNGCMNDKNGETMRAFLLKQIQERKACTRENNHAQAFQTWDMPGNTASGYDSMEYRYSSSGYGIGETLLDIVTSKKLWIGLLVVIAMVFLFKTCGKAGDNVASTTSSTDSLFSAFFTSITDAVGNFFTSMGTGIGAFFAKVWSVIKTIFAFALTLVFIVVPLVVLFRNRAWRDKGSLIMGGILFLFAYYILKGGTIAYLIATFIFWMFGIKCWSKAD